MTIECVEHIRKSCAQTTYSIIIVDNASTNGGGKILLEKFGADTDCKVLLNKENLGFAQGNNVGWIFAKKYLNPDYIVIMNNDVLIEDKEFCSKIVNINAKHPFDILGPDIFAVKKGEHQNPMRLQLYSIEEVEKIVSDREKWLRYYSFHYYGNEILSLIKRIIKNMLHIKTEQNSYCSCYKEKLIENPVLHGACLIFAKSFITNEEYAFNPNTFLYFEEELLYFYCQQNEYHMIYSSELQVDHLEDVSTNIAFSSDYKKTKMKYENIVKSANVLLKLMKKQL